MSELIRATIENTIFRAPDSGYCVFKVKDRHGSRFCVVGRFDGSVRPGLSLLIHGQWEEHPKYGMQFRCNHYTLAPKQTTRGIVEFLTNFVKGIGPSLASKIVKAFGEKTLDVIINEPHRLLTVKGVGERKLTSIIESVREIKATQELAAYLIEMNVTPGYAAMIVSHFGVDALRIVKEDPYRLTEVRGIGFLIADKIATKNGIPLEDENRLFHGIIYTLEKAQDEGHTCLPFEELVSRAMDILSVNSELIKNSIYRLCTAGHLTMVTNARGAPYVFLQHNRVYEEGIAREVKRLSRYCGTRQRMKVQRTIAETSDVRLSDEQQHACLEALTSGISIITGGPGTGKTTVINTIVQTARKLGFSCVLCAPTGRAAKRMSEACNGEEALTIHRLLKFDPSTYGFQRGPNNPIPSDLVIVDESSMVDIRLAYYLLRAVRLGGSIVFVGDVDQLPSVGAGTFLTDLIKSGVVSVCRLTRIYRQAQNSMIVTNAHRVNQGKMPWLKGASNRDFIFENIDKPELIRERIVSLIEEMMRLGYDPLRDVQVVTPMRKGPIGVESLNATIRKKLIALGLVSDRERLETTFATYSVGDKIIQLVNNYDKEIFNGDTGVITSVDTEEGTVTVDFGHTVVSLTIQELRDTAHAYAITIHKSQGSEYPVVIMPIHTSHYILLFRNLLYTAITRAKERFLTVGTPKAIGMAVHRNDPSVRYSLLRETILDKTKPVSEIVQADWKMWTNNRKAGRRAQWTY